MLVTVLDSLKTTSKKVVQNAGKFLGNKVGETKTKSKHEKIVKQEPSEKVITSPENIDEMLHKLTKVL